MIAEFGTTPYGGSQGEWIEEALYNIRNRYQEIQALVFFYSKEDKNWATKWRPSPQTQHIDWTFSDIARLDPVRESLRNPPFSNRPE